MKMILFALFVLAGTSAFATTGNTAECYFGEKVVSIILDDSGSLVGATWANPDWGVYGAHELQLSQVEFDGQNAVITGDAIPDANGVYTCQ